MNSTRQKGASRFVRVPVGAEMVVVSKPATVGLLGGVVQQAKGQTGQLFLFHRHQDNNMQGEKFTSVKAVGIAQDRNARFRRTMEVRSQQPRTSMWFLQCKQMKPPAKF